MMHNGLLVCTEMALLAKPFSARTKLIKKAQNLLKPLSAIFVQTCGYVFALLFYLVYSFSAKSRFRSSIFFSRSPSK